jgi:1-acyl-sn-glycerol-3-phosphate acyltransferase
MARKTLFSIPLLGKLLPHFNVISVDRDGNDRTALKTVLRLLKQGEGVVLFPEGTRSPDGNLQKAQSGIGLMIAKTKAPVLPMRLFGAHEAFPKNSKFPIRHPIRIVLGKPLYFSEQELTAPKGKERELYQELADKVMNAIDSLQLPE